jgi:predicted acyl esterase
VLCSAAVLAFVAASCSSDDSSSDDASATTIDLSDDLVTAEWEVQPGVEQVTVTGAEPGEPLTLVDSEGLRRLTLEADDEGQANFAYLPAEHLTTRADDGAGDEHVRGGTVVEPGEYRVVDETTDPLTATDEFVVAERDDHPDPSFYDDQEIEEGFNYIEMRDGVTLSANVTFPDPALYGEGPYPTVVEYSGYSPSNPDGGDPGSVIANLLGFATVGVNMRGSGCSGGVFDLFSPAQQADGYDVIEAVARQPWVMHNEVGMIGLSYSGITQLYVASTAPPSLAAITPLSVIEDLYRIQRPGGVYNTGFTRQWLAERDASQREDGSSWVTDKVAEGDTTCEQNIGLRDLNPDFQAFGEALEFYEAPLPDRRLGYLVSDIEVPVYLTGAWQDEQTGGWFPTMLDDFTGTDTKKFTLFNGRHPDGYTPMVLTRWYEFLELYVAKRVPRLDPVVRAAAPGVFLGAFGVEGLGFEDDRFTEFADDDYEGALAAYEAEPMVRVLFESGAGSDVPGAPVSRFEVDFDEWPPPTEAATWYLGPDGTLTEGEPDESTGGVDQYTHDPEAGAISYTDTSAGDFVFPQIEFDWTRFAAGKQLSYVTEPFEDDLVLLGPGYADLWFASEEEDVNVQVTVSLLQPDGTEWFVQGGWLRIGHRKIDEERSDDFTVEYTYAADDFEPLEPGEFIETKVPIFPVGQVFRAGTRLRLTIETPGRNLPLWLFENPDYSGDVTHEVARTPDMASFLRLPALEATELTEVDIPDDPPPCPSLRGQVCRPYEPVANESAG